MRHKLRFIPEPQPDHWPHRRAFSFRMNAGYFAPVADVGDKIYCARSHRVRARGGEYIMATGSGDATRYVIVSIQRASEKTWDALIYGWNRRRTRFGKTRVRLSRQKWRPAFKVRGITVRSNDP